MRLWIGLAALALAPAPAVAQTIKPMPEPAADYAAMPADELARQLRVLSEDDPVCSHAFPILRELAERRADLPEIATQAQRAEMICANQRLDFATAYRILKANPAVEASVNGLFALYLTSMAGDGAAMPAAFERVFSGEDNSLENLDPDILYLALRKARELGTIEAVDKRALAAVRRADVRERLDPEVRKILSASALDAAARAGDAAGARTLLADIEDPAAFDALLGERMYETVWPAVEARVGPNYSQITPAYRTAAMKRYEAGPGKPYALNDAVRGLYYDGRYAEVIAFVDKVTGRPDLIATMTEDEGWALNLKAYSLDALKRPQEASAVLDMLAKAGALNKSWGVNFVINRALRLAGQKRWPEALTAAAEAKEIADEFGSDYAKGLVAYTQVCTLHGLGRTAEASAALAVLEKTSSQHPGNHACVAMPRP